MAEQQIYGDACVPQYGERADDWLLLVKGRCAFLAVQLFAKGLTTDALFCLVSVRQELARWDRNKTEQNLIEDMFCCRMSRPLFVWSSTKSLYVIFLPANECVFAGKKMSRPRVAIATALGELEAQQGNLEAARTIFKQGLDRLSAQPAQESKDETTRWIGPGRKASSWTETLAAEGPGQLLLSWAKVEEQVRGVDEEID